MAFYCPNCNAQIVNRKITKCMNCFNDLPEDLLFTAEQLRAVKENNAKAQRDYKKAFNDNLNELKRDNNYRTYIYTLSH